jgi:hypothetical protein
LVEGQLGIVKKHATAADAVERVIVYEPPIRTDGGETASATPFNMTYH